jgi:LacI family transcriptional regulator
VVLIDDRGHQPRFPSVATTNYDGGASAARHLISIGRRRPLVITGVAPFGCTQDRQFGFAEAYEAAGSPLDAELVIEGDFTFDAGRDVVKRILERGLSFDGIFAHNDLSAAGAMTALREVGLRVPEDVAVVGFDDIPLAAHTDPPLTTVHQPMREMGGTAAKLLLSHFGGATLSAEPQIIPTTLIVRGSSVP